MKYFPTRSDFVPSEQFVTKFASTPLGFGTSFGSLKICCDGVNGLSLSVKQYSFFSNDASNLF